MTRRIRQGNTIDLRYRLYRADGDSKVPEELAGISLTATLRNKYLGNRVDIPLEVSGNQVQALIPGIPLLRPGIYNLALSYKKDGYDHAIDQDAFEIVDSSAKAGGSTVCPDIEVQTIELSGTIDTGPTPGGGISGQVQADWAETDPDSKAYILHKPSLKVADWNASFSWGDHAKAGYAKAGDIAGIRTRMTEIEAIARGRSRAKTFETMDELEAWLADPGNIATLQVGDNLYIEADGVPDYWWNGTGKLPLETEKVDLTGYARRSELDRYVTAAALEAELERTIGDIALVLDEINGEVI